MEAVVGPGARGVVVATEDPERAIRDRMTLRAAGIPAATTDELGLRLTEEISGPPGEGLIDLAGYWGVVTRRPVLATAERELIAVGPVPVELQNLRAWDPADAARRVIRRTPGSRVSVFGGAWVQEREPEYAEARRLGERMARGHVEVVCGGYGGVMAAVCRGAKEAGGVAVGITIAAWSGRVVPNEWMTHQAVARDLFARLPLMFDAEAWVAFSGGAGTLAEVALGWNLVQTRSVQPRPIVLVGDRWGRALEALRPLLLVRDPGDYEAVGTARSADEAADLALEHISRGAEPRLSR